MLFLPEKSCEHDWAYQSKLSRICRKCGTLEVYTDWLMPGYEHPTGPAWGIPAFAYQQRDFRFLLKGGIDEKNNVGISV